MHRQWMADANLRFRVIPNDLAHIGQRENGYDDSRTNPRNRQYNNVVLTNIAFDLIRVAVISPLIAFVWIGMAFNLACVIVVADEEASKKKGTAGR